VHGAPCWPASPWARCLRRGAQGDSASGAENCDGLSRDIAAFALASGSGSKPPGLDASVEVAGCLGLDAAAADEVPTPGFLPSVRDLGQPSATIPQAWHEFDVGIPGAQPDAVASGGRAGLKGVNQ